MKKRFSAFVAAIVLALSTLAATPAPAQASWSCDAFAVCGQVYHYSPDDGFDDPFKIVCDWNNPYNSQRSLAEGQKSQSYCGDADGLYVSQGNVVACTAQGSLYGGFPIRYGWGLHKINNDTKLWCVHQKA